MHRDCGYRAYTLISVDDLYNPFASMYFGASYLAWLSQYEGREQSYEFIVQAYLGGPENVSLQETGPFWNQFLESLTQYQDPKKYACAFCLTVCLTFLTNLLLFVMKFVTHQTCVAD
ncbi:transglycosylase SLT domain containing protein expressed [Zea mays]|uniref:Transglycosylase SLT domain containing protein expressed n=1 Tax=Zea mays TaxID=4577 RepID=A0A1D6QSC8_MAIZE|nr:transglycosylase SLT domain containing protein expressed [Zea mays]